MSNIVLSASVRQNLLSLQSTADLLATTQERLSAGKKVNTALDNPTNYFTAAALDSRAGDINNLLDGIGNGVQWISVVHVVQEVTSSGMQARVLSLLEAIGAALPVAAHLRLGPLGEVGEVADVRPGDPVGLAGLGQAIGGVLADGL